MAANGKRNGKKQDQQASRPPASEGKGQKNGKAKEGRAPAEAEAEPAEGAGAGAESERKGGAAGEPGKPGGEPGDAPEAARAATEDAGEGEGGEGEAAASAAGHAGAGGAGGDDEVRGAAWARPFVRFERAWTRLESRLLTFVLVSLILSLVGWVFLKGLCEPVTTVTGTVFRGLLLAIGLGLGGLRLARGHGDAQRRNATLMGIAVGIGIVAAWRAEGAGAGESSFDNDVVAYFDNIKGWLQDGSTLALLGGPRGLATRLTLWLALLGGSLATASGKHIHVDVVFRFLPKGARMPVAILNYVFASAVCFAAVWGFFDHIAITSFGSNADDRPAVKIEGGLHHVGNHLFFTRKQIGLDLRSLPHVIKGEKYDTWMTAAAWNEWVDGAGFEDHFDPKKVKDVLHIAAGTHSPFVLSPDGETTRGVLTHTLGLVFPFGLLAIALRFLLRALLTLSGHFVADPDEAHKEDLRSAGEGEAAKGGA